MAEYNSDRTGANIDATLDKVDALVDSANNVTANGLTVDGDILVNRTSAFTNAVIEVQDDGAGEVLALNNNGTDGQFLRLYNSGTLIGGFGNNTSAVSSLNIYRGSTPAISIHNATGDVSFYEDTGTTAKMVWDASEEELNVIGQVKAGVSANPVRINSSPATGIVEFNSTDLGIIRTVGSTSLRLQTNSTDRLSINASGNVGVGTSSPTANVSIKGTTGFTGLDIADGTDRTILGYHVSDGFRITNISAKPIVFKTNDSERARIDSSGNLLVGKTGTSNSTAGAELNASGQIVGTFANGTHILGRNTNDGSILELQKDGLTVGSIGTASGSIQFADGNDLVRLKSGKVELRTSGDMGGIFVDDTVNAMWGGVDGLVDLGRDNFKYKDLYLSGGVYLGGTGSANKLDDYEEGTWTPTLYCQGGGSMSLNVVSAHYTKVGNKITVSCYISQINTTGETLTGALRIGGLPYSGKAFMQVGGLTYTNLFSFDEQDKAITGHMDGGAVFHPKIGSSTTSIDASQINASTSGAMMFGITYLEA